MKDFKLINSDLTVDPLGNFLIIEDAECVEQMIVCALQLFIGEYEYNKNLGLSLKLAMQQGFSGISILQYQTQQTIFALNSYIKEPNLQIKRIEPIETIFNENRELIINVTVILINGDILEVSTNV